MKLGNILIFLFITTTICLYFLAKGDLGDFLAIPLLSLSQLTSLVGLTLLAITFFLAGRLSFLENLFGGLDRVYKIHRLAGSIAFILILNHPLLWAINSLPSTSLAVTYLSPGPNWSYNFGLFALWSLIIFIFFTLFINLPYHLWKRIHEFTGIAFFLSLAHILTIKSSVLYFLPLKIWLLTLMVITSFSYLYKRFFYGHFGSGHLYIIDCLTRRLDLIEICLAPIHANIKYAPGQFAFISLQSKNLSSEPHPFSIASSPKDNHLRFCIKIVGDYTLRLRELKIGDLVKVAGPYGQFSQRFFNSGKEAIFIAGGIGVTPFLSILKTAVDYCQLQKIFFFYCATNETEAYYHEELQTLVGRAQNIDYYLCCSEKNGRLNAKIILTTVGNFRDKIIFLCGPLSMMINLRSQFLLLGVRQSNIIFEDFSLK